GRGHALSWGWGIPSWIPLQDTPDRCPETRPDQPIRSRDPNRVVNRHEAGELTSTAVIGTRGRADGTARASSRDGAGGLPGPRGRADGAALLASPRTASGPLHRHGG